MVYTIGPIWFWVYAIAALFSIIGGLLWAFSSAGERESPVSGIVTLFVGIVLAYFSIFAGTHFRVKVNERALVVNQIKGEIEGERMPGVQSKPLIGVTICNWPANKAYQVFLDLQPGTASASASDQIALWVDTKLFLDLSNLDLERAYRAVNGCYDVFYSKYLETQLMNLVRLTSQDFTVLEHNTKKAEWAASFDANAEEFFQNTAEGYGIQIVPGRTTMSWDFVQPADAEAFDQANRAAYLITQRLNEQKALQIELEMARTRGEILVETSNGAVKAWEEVVSYVQGLSPETQKFLVEYMQLQGNLEYLRLVGQIQPDMFFPPSSQPNAVYDVNQQSQPVVEPTPTP